MLILCIAIPITLATVFPVPKTNPKAYFAPVKTETIMLGILGGGISGLSSAVYLSRAFPGQKIILLNVPYPHGSWGGWIGTIHRPSHFFELGPRTLRPSRAQGAVTLDLVHSLGLQDEIHPISKTSKAAKNRYIYSHGRLQTLPSSLFGMLFQSPPVMKGLIGRVLKEPFIPSGQVSNTADLADESIHAFLTRRLGRCASQSL